MSNKIIQKITEQQGNSDLITFLTQKLSNSELNSLLLEVFHQRSQQITPSQLLKQYENNRFVQPIASDYLSFLDFEIPLLKIAKQHDFEIIEFSPVAPLGSCSVMGSVHQNKVLTALRGTEVVADATNMMALEISKRRKKSNLNVSLVAAHRHLRTQLFNFPGFTPHFKIFCLSTGGKTTGNYGFERLALIQHFKTYLHILRTHLGIDNTLLSIRFILTEDVENLISKIYHPITTAFPKVPFSYEEKNASENLYYKKLQFKISYQHNNQSYDIIDGGLVNWTQQLLQNRKERLLISGLGSSFLFGLL